MNLWWQLDAWSYGNKNIYIMLQMPLTQQLFLLEPEPSFRLFEPSEAPGAPHLGSTFLIFVLAEVAFVLILDINVNKKRKKRKRRESVWKILKPGNENLEKETVT